MKAKSSLILTSIILSFLLTSCGTYYYYPFKQNTFNFEEKGDLQIGYAIDGYFTNFHLGSAVTDNIGFIFDGNFKEGPFTEKPLTYIADAELVFFKKYKSNLLAEFNIGYGYGKKRWRYDDDFRFTLQRPFVQPSIGYVHKYFEIGLSSRISSLKYDFFMSEDFYKNYELNQYKTSYSIIYNDNKYYWFIEPAFTVSLKYNGLKFQCQYIEAKQLSSHEIDYYKDNLILSLSYTFNLNRVLKK